MKKFTALTFALVASFGFMVAVANHSVSTQGARSVAQLDLNDPIYTRASQLSEL
jgi:hypothetical protein